MPVLDTVVLFSASDPSEPFHDRSLKHLSKLGDSYLLGAFALVEFDVVLKSRNFSHEQRMMEMTMLERDFPRAADSVHPITPGTFFLAALYEQKLELDYFDALLASEAMQHDGKILSTDRAFDTVPNLKRIF